MAQRIATPLGLTNTYLAQDPERLLTNGFGFELPSGSTQNWDYTCIETAAGARGALAATARRAPWPRRRPMAMALACFRHRSRLVQAAAATDPSRD